MRPGAALLIGATFLVAGAARAQEAQDSGQASPRLTVELRRDSLSGLLLPPRVQAQDLMRDGTFEGALRNGFPVRFSFRLSLWRDARFFDRLLREAEWEAVVVLDPVDNTYQLIRSVGAAEVLPDSRTLDRALATPFTVDLLPPAGNARYYYIVTLTVESLSVSELEEVERWLTGDLGRAITQRGDVGNAFTRGARLALIRLSGLPRRVLNARTGYFRR